MSGWVAAIGAVVGVVSSLSQAQAASDTAKYNRDVANNNAIAAKQQGDAALIQQRKQAERRMGSIAAAYSASGVSMEGSALDVIEESAGQAELDSQNLQYNTRLKMQGYSDSANLYSAQADNAETSGYMGAANSVLKGYNTYKSNYGSSVKTDMSKYEQTSDTFYG